MVLIAGGRLRDRLVEEKRDELGASRARRRAAVDAGRRRRFARAARRRRARLSRHADRQHRRRASATPSSARRRGGDSRTTRRARRSSARATHGVGIVAPAQRVGRRRRAVRRAAASARLRARVAHDAQPRRDRGRRAARRARERPGRARRRARARVAVRAQRLAAGRRAARRRARASPPATSTRRPALSAPGEVGDLATALHRMAEQLASRLDALEADDLLMTAVLESLEEGVLAVDERGMVVRINQRARTLLGVADAAALRARAAAARADAARRDRAGAAPARARAPTEVALHDRTVAIASRPLVTGGGVVTMLDLTVLRRLETIRRDFVANVSHELKTPLTAVSGYAETLLDDGIPAEQRRRFVETIRDNATRMQRIVDDLLDLSRIESGGWRPNASAVDVGARGDATCSPRCSRRAAAKGLALVADDRAGRDARARRPDGVPTDRSTNLVENAVRYTREGSVTLRTRAARRRRLGRRERHRHRHRAGAPAAHLRALLPRGRGPLARAGRHRARPRDRAAPRRGARRPRRGDERRRDAARRSACSFPT